MKNGRTPRSMTSGLWVAVLFGLSACAATPMAPGGVCGSRAGHCFDAVINDQPVVPLRSEAVLQPFVEVTHYVRDVEWQLAEPITGPLTAAAAINEAGLDWLGPRARMQLQVIPLDGQDLAAHQVLTRRDDVRVGAQAVTTVSDVLESNILPPGNYLLRITARGDNWDRKTVFVVVR